MACWPAFARARAPTPHPPLRYSDPVLGGAPDGVVPGNDCWRHRGGPDEVPGAAFHWLVGRGGGLQPQGDRAQEEGDQPHRQPAGEGWMGSQTLLVCGAARASHHSASALTFTHSEPHSPLPTRTPFLPAPCRYRIRTTACSRTGSRRCSTFCSRSNRRPAESRRPARCASLTKRPRAGGGSPRRGSDALVPLRFTPR
eukprot:scaffold7948_cov94-Isochrysis_galbana.AAC.3